MSEPYLGQIMLFAGPFAPRGWAFCNGQLLNIAQNSALFAVLGVTYGGNGTTTFALPDLRSRVPVHAGQGGGLSNYALGQSGGVEQVTLNIAQLPSHNHMVNADASPGTSATPASGNLAETSDGEKDPTLTNTYTTGTPGSPVQLNGSTIASTGSSQGHPNVQPYLALNFVIAIQGLFPQRN